VSGTRLILLAASLLLCASLSARERLVGLHQSPKGIGVSAIFDTSDGREMNIFTLRTDFYGVLTGRTSDIGACLVYTHDYTFFRQDREQYSLLLHAGAGGMAGYTHDFEKGVFSAYERQLVLSPGWTFALAGNVGLRVDFRKRLSMDISLSALPGIHIRTDNKTGAVLVGFYRNGVYQAFFPQLNLMYRF